MMKKLALLVFVVACGGGGDDGDNSNPDASQTPKDAAVDAQPVDAAAATVMTVPCAGATIAQMVMTAEGPRRFTPNDITISVNAIVQFTTSGSHNVIPRAGMPSDPGLMVGFGETKCLRFTAAGSFNYRCAPHADMTGVVKVQ